jgi:HEAT repeat protein
MPHWTLDSAPAFRALAWSTAALVAALLALLAATALLQFRADRRNARRIANLKRWEAALPGYAFGEGEIPAVFTQVDRRDWDNLRDFLGRALALVGGVEGERIKWIFFAAGLQKDVPERLRSGSSRERAGAVTEVGTYALTNHLQELVPLLRDPVPFVSHAAARTLAQSRDLSFAGPVVEWVFSQDQYQQERLVALLECFGPALLPWLESLLRDQPCPPSGWRLFALLVSGHNHHESLPVLLELLGSPMLEVRSAAIGALQTIGDPVAFPSVLPFARHAEPLLRMQAARSLGILGGPQAIPELCRLLADAAYDVRRHASHSLANLGRPGIAVLKDMAADPTGDPFARDMAVERLEWVQQRGRL